jgi:four helix bundle protein
MQDHTKLRVWQRAHALTLTVFTLTNESSFRSAAGLGGQLQRAMASIGANIAEGAGQDTTAQFARFLSMAIASANEVANHLALARDTQCISAVVAEELLVELGVIRAMLITLQRRVRQRATPDATPSLPP